MKHIIDINTWYRRDNYYFFKDFINPCMALTCDVDCTNAYTKSRQRGESFFAYYLYAVHRAVNEIEEFRYRHDNMRRVVLYDIVDMITPIATKNGNFYTIRIPYNPIFSEYVSSLRAIIDAIPENGNPYFVENEIQKSGQYDVTLLSATPKLRFTALTYTQKDLNKESNYPLMVAGGFSDINGKKMMPLSICVSHAFMDGSHISDFYEKVQLFLNEM